MTNLIDKVFIIQIVLNYEAYTREIHMTNISEILGTDGIKLRCSYTKDSNDRVSGVTFLTVNDSDIFVKIAEATIFSTQPELLPYGVYLFGSANITKLSDSPSEVVLTFNNLNCKHERNYICKLSVRDTSPTYSTPMPLFVKVPPLKPDRVEIIKAPMDVLTTTETARVDTSTSSVTESVTTSTSTGTKSVNTSMSSETTKSAAITSQRSNSSTTTSLLNFSTSIFDNNITTTTNTFYNSTSSTEPTPDSPCIIEGDNITVKCSGNVGKPAGILTFQKFRKHNIQSTTYVATTTKIEEIPDNCSYYSTSYLIFQVTAEDNLAVIRCVVVSPLAGQDMFTDSEQLKVKSDTSTSPSSSTGSCSGTEEKSGNPTKNITIVNVIIGVSVGVVFLLVLLIVGYKLHKRNKKGKDESPENKGSTNNLMHYNSKYVGESRPSAYDSVALEGDAPVISSGKKEQNVEDVRKHNEEYMKKQTHEGKIENKSPTSHQPVIYAAVNEATKSKYRQNIETQDTSNQEEDDTYAGTQEGIYDQSGNRRHKVNENAEQFDKIGDIKNQNSTDDTESSIQSSKRGSYVNQAFNKGEKRQVATVPPISRSSGGSQGDEQTSESNDKLSKKGYENVKGTDNTYTPD